MATAILSLLTAALAALLYRARVEVTVPGGGWLKGLSVYTYGVPALLSGAIAFVVAAFAFFNASSRGTAISLVLMPSLAMLTLFVAAIRPVGKTLLSGIHRQDAAAVRTALQAGVDPNTRETWGWDNYPGPWALAAAARQGNAEIVRLLIAHGATVNTNDRDAPLIAAANAGQLEVVRLLLDAGADPNFADEQGQSACRRAVLMGHLDVAQVLVAAGAKPEVIPVAGDLP